MQMNLLQVLSQGGVELACYAEKVSSELGNMAAGINAVNKGMGLGAFH